MKELGKTFVECDQEGNETVLGDDVLIGESWELADMGIEDSVVENGWLAGNTIGELMETYLERIVGEDVYRFYGRQFPLLIKFLDINDKLSVQVHPDDEVAASSAVKAAYVYGEPYFKQSRRDCLPASPMQNAMRPPSANLPTDSPASLAWACSSATHEYKDITLAASSSVWAVVTSFTTSAPW